MQIIPCEDNKQTFAIKTRSGIFRISFEMLEYVEVINKTVSLHLADGRVHEVTGALSDFEKELLQRLEFAKTHRSYIINLKHVQSIVKDGAVTDSGHVVPVSRKQRGKLYDAYMSCLLTPETGV